MFRQGEYLKGTMTQEEIVLVRAKYHWIAWLGFYFIFATLGVAAIIAFMLALSAYSNNELEASIFYSILGFILAIYPISYYLSLHLTEMACTNKRVVFKKGVISIKTEELKNDKVEAIEIEQSFWGRLLGYGNICFVGMGSSKVDFINVANPWQIKAKAEEAVEQSKQSQKQ